MLKGIFGALNLNPVGHIEGARTSPKKLVDLDYMLAQRLRDESSLEERRKSVPRYKAATPHDSPVPQTPEQPKPGNRYEKDYKAS